MSLRLMLGNVCKIGCKSLSIYLPCEGVQLLRPLPDLSPVVLGILGLQLDVLAILFTSF